MPIIPVDYAAKSIVGLSKSNGRNKIFHLTGDKNISFFELVKCYNGNSKTNFIKIVSLSEFINEIKKYISNGKFLSIIPFILEVLDMASESDQKQWFADNTDFNIDSSFTKKSLKECKIDFPKINDDIIMKYWNNIASNIV